MALFLLLFNDISANIPLLAVTVTWTIIASMAYVIWLADLARRSRSRSAPEYREAE
jgi:hypothetical protein